MILKYIPYIKPTSSHTHLHSLSSIPPYLMRIIRRILYRCSIDCMHVYLVDVSIDVLPLFLLQMPIISIDLHADAYVYTYFSLF
jgi:hypothetical protein